MRSILSSLGSPSCLLLVLALGCGDSTGEAANDEAGDAPTGTESGDGSNPEAGSQGNEANSTTNDSSSGETGSSSSESGETLGTGEGVDTSDSPSDSTGGETEQPIDCTVFDIVTCQNTDICVPYMGMPYTTGIDGLLCLGPEEFLGCVFAMDACLPATGTLCMGDQAFAVDNLCPPPQGFAMCEPPVDGAMPCM